jgi:hypothetical protein
MSCVHTPYVWLDGQYPSCNAPCCNSLFAMMPACGRPYMPFWISMHTLLSTARSFQPYLLITSCGRDAIITTIYLYCSRGCYQESGPRRGNGAVENHFVVVMPALRVDLSPGYSIGSPPTVKCVRSVFSL